MTAPAVAIADGIGMAPYYDDGQVTIYCGDCLDVMAGMCANTADVIVTSPPYNLGRSRWNMGGDGGKGWDRKQRADGIGYAAHDDGMSQDDYEAWQVAVLTECYRVAISGASMFYNHKTRTVDGRLVSPLRWLESDRCPWTVRQELVWNRGSTFNHNPALFWPEDERIYWLTNGKAKLTDRPIAQSTVWYIAPDQPSPPHPAPFPIALPLRCLRAVARPGITVYDPFAGIGTTLAAARLLGLRGIGSEINEEHCSDAVKRLRQQVLPL